MVESADFSFEEISADELNRLQALYGPLTDAVRRVVQAGIRTGADEQTIREAQASIEAVAEKLEASADADVVRMAVDGRPVVWGNPVTGFRNAIAPPLIMHTEPDGLWWSEFEVGEPYQGPPGWVHGGVLALVLDQVLGEVASEGLSKPMFTGTITMRYLRGTPLGRLRAEAAIERIDGYKTFVSGHISDSDGKTVEAEGIWIKPAWARGAG
ncbi:thioesterase [Mycolicibacterium agri]|uniref:Acyl-coenzyme A thioesterase THEM4 n=1 Tax=Mycolicibacterium agri TaxID=36811 RepID=A0A2A7MSE8_MYCAG|nr:PaaI family thioesterase [Mycolicibacterium agri]PEG34645.1 thioesterase [Mycolicibacterium agri]GFG55138.1 thioesterase [Mycolicibacterium agri]